MLSDTAARYSETGVAAYVAHLPSGPHAEVRELPEYVYAQDRAVPSTGSVLTLVTWPAVQVKLSERREMPLVILVSLPLE